MSAHLRGQGISAISLGKGSNGPLTQLATIKEYAGQLRPKVVFWFYATNDLSDLKEEREVDFLQNYLIETGYSQKLYFRQNEIKSFVGTEMENRVTEELLKKKKVRKKLEREKIQRYAFHSSSLVRVVKLYNLRLLLDLTPSSIGIQSDAPERDETSRLFREILREAKDYVSKWNGTLVFVYLAPYERYKTGAPHSEKEKVIDIVNELSIPIVDSHREAFSRHLDPKGLFPLGLNGHYNSDGYRVLAELLERRLQQLGSG
jgi:lysophospholipase L1-like esterase